MAAVAPNGFFQAQAATRSALSASFKALADGNSLKGDFHGHLLGLANAFSSTSNTAHQLTLLVLAALNEAYQAEEHLHEAQQLAAPLSVGSLTFATTTSLAVALASNQRYTEAMQAYQAVLKQRPQVCFVAAWIVLFSAAIR